MPTAPHKPHLLFTLTLLTLLSASLFLRFLHLSSLPGLNADEAAGGLAVQSLLSGNHISLRTGSHQFFNPAFLASESLLLAIFPPSFFLLRITAAAFCTAGIAATFLLHRRLYRSTTQALAAATIFSCLPLNLAYSRLAWDPTYLLFWTPLFLYPALAAARGPQRRLGWLWLTVVAFAILWTHFTAALLLCSIAAALVIVRRADLANWLSRHHGPTLPPNTFATLTLLLTSLLAVAAWFPLRHHSIHIAAFSPDDLRYTWTHWPLAVSNLRIVGDVVGGYAVCHYIAAYPHTPLWDLTSWLTIPIILYLSLRLAQRSEDPADRTLALTTLIYSLLLPASGSALQFEIPGHERYAVAYLCLIPALVTRTLSLRRLPTSPLPHSPLPQLLLLTIPTLHLLSFSTCFYLPLRHATYLPAMEPTFWTIPDIPPRDPKSQAAQLLKEWSQENPRARVFAETWWLELPLRFLLPTGPTIVPGKTPATRADARAGFFIAAYARSQFLSDATHALHAAHLSYTRRAITSPDGTEYIVLLYVPPSP